MEHKWSEFATCIAPGGKHSSDFVKTFGKRDWAELRRTRTFDGNEDATVVYAILCPNDEGGQMLLLTSPAELWANDSFWGLEDIDAADAAEVRSVVHEWHVIRE